MSAPTILVTGSNGQLGNELKIWASKQEDFNFIFTNRHTLDITNSAQISQFFEEHVIDYCINTAAYTAVDKAESEPELAHLVNVKAVTYLAKVCQVHRVQLIHFSSDYVFHTDHNRPYIETDETHPKGVYAVSKLAGEEQALIAPNAIVIRTSWVYSRFGKNFVKTMLRLGRKLDQLRIIYDQIGTPTHAADLAEATMNILQKINHIDNYGGIYHYSNEGVTCWYDFAKAIFELKNIDCKITPIESKDYPTAAQRPHFSVLNKTKIKQTFGIKIPYWRDSLKACLHLLE